MRQAARAKKPNESVAERSATPNVHRDTNVLTFPTPDPGQHPSLMTARVVALCGSEATLEIGGRTSLAELDASVSPVVIDGAIARKERVLVERSDDRMVVIGVLRTQPTPGIDRADAYRIEAAHVTVEGDEVVLSSKTAKVILRAASEIESFAERIVSRAEGVHKIVGRMLRLN